MQANTAGQTQSDLYTSKDQEVFCTDAALEKSRSTSRPKKGMRPPLAARCNVDVQEENGATYFLSPQLPSHSLASLLISRSLSLSLSLSLIIWNIRRHQRLLRSPSTPSSAFASLSCTQSSLCTSEGYRPEKLRNIFMIDYVVFKRQMGVCLCVYVYLCHTDTNYFFDGVSPCGLAPLAFLA